MLCVALAFAVLFAATTVPLRAQTSRVSAVTGIVMTSDGTAIGGARVVLRGVASVSSVTGASGTFRFPSILQGRYQIVVSKSGFFQYQSSILVSGSENVSLSVTLAASSFASLRTIAQVSTNPPGRMPINQSPASIVTIPNAVFANQGQLQVTNILNETPGIISWSSGRFSTGNGASEGTSQVVQIRGALPYETESLVDGNPAPISLTGNFNPIYLNAGLLQEVEVVKGPGYMGPDINYAIGGAVNYVTLQPTRTPQASFTIGFDNWGGVSTSFTATGSTSSHVLDYAFGYATNGTPGPLQNYQVAGSQMFITTGQPFSWKINGLSPGLIPLVIAPPPETRYYRYSGVPGSQIFAEPLYVCCYGLNTGFDSNAQLGKIRLNLSPTSSLTLSYLGGQAFADLGNFGPSSVAPVGSTGSWAVFAPPAGYSGAVPPGTDIPFDIDAFAPVNQSVQQNLYQAEVRTQLGQWTALARYFASAGLDSIYAGGPANAPYIFSGRTWGGVPLCQRATEWNPNTGECDPGNVAPTLTYFNGQETTFSTFDAVSQYLENDHLRGESLFFDRPSSNGGDLTISFDRTLHFSYEFVNQPQENLPAQYPLPRGASQAFDTVMVRGRFFIAPHVFASVANYFIQYESHYSDKGGFAGSWFDATRGYNAPRLGVTWQPNENVSWRLATGASIAPPYLRLLSATSAPTENIDGLPSAGFTENLNNGLVAPETAYGYDLGVDNRIRRAMSLSADVYLTNLFNMFLPSTFLITDSYVPPGSSTGYPLYGSITENLGRARYEGVEFTLQNAPALGWGFKAQGSLQRAYTYALPPGFYCINVPASQCTPLHYSTNLGIIPGMNFQAGGLGWNSISGAAVPYSMGYAEVNYRSKSGAYLGLGTTYFGSNNAYSLPAFFVFNAAIREPIPPGAALQLSIDNLFDAYGSAWPFAFGGIAAPLEPQCIGKYGTKDQGLTGAACASLARPADRVVIPQVGATVAGNYGPPTLRLQLIEHLSRP